MATTGNYSNNETVPSSSITLDIVCKTFGIPLAVFILIGNILFSIIAFRARRSPSRVIVANLTINDILVGFTLILSFTLESLYDTLGSNSNRHVYCKLWAVIQIIPIYQQFTFLLSLNIDRFIAVSFPAIYSDTYSSKNVWKVCGGLWIYALCIAALFFAFNGTVNDSGTRCDVMVLSPPYLVTVLAIHMLLSLLATVAFYVRMKHILNHHQKKIQVTNTMTYDKLVGDIAVAKMYLCLTIATFIIWTPLFICSLFHLINDDWSALHTVVRVFLLVGYISSLRCIIFTFMSSDYKTSLLSLFLRNKIEIQTRPSSTL